MSKPVDRFPRRPRLVVQSLEDRTTPAQFVVTSAADSGPGTLRAAIDLANVSVFPDEIVFDTAGVFATPQTILLADRLPEASPHGSTLTITGPGADRLTVDGQDLHQGLRSRAPEFNLSGFTIANMYAGSGAALSTSFITRLDGMVLRDSHADFSGGAVFLDGDSFLSVRNSLITGNSTDFGGGGIYCFYNGSLLVENSTISGNTAVGTGLYTGGGIHFWGEASSNPPRGFTAGALVIRNSTIANNAVTGPGGGGAINLVDFDGTLRVENSTITGNTATALGAGGGGIRKVSGPGTIEVINSIVSDNVNSAAPDIKATGTVNVNFSAIGSTTGFTLTGANNLIGVNLLLGSLQDNGGPTPTILPQTGSPLINAGVPDTGLAFDQRGFGFVRTFGTASDIGSAEAQPPGVPFGVPELPEQTVAGATTHEFTVTYYDVIGAGLDVATLIGSSGAVRATGPNGFNVPAMFVAIDNPTNGSPRTVTYSFTPPGGAWDPADNGAYSVKILADAVKDLDGNAVPAGTLGTLSVFIPLDLVVTTTADAGPGSLREAIALTNAAPTDDTIAFDPGLFGTSQTITLATPLPQINDTSGALAITGPGAAQLTVSGNNAFRVLDTINPRLTLSGFTVANGLAANALGGGMLAGGFVTLDHMAFTGNTSTATGFGFDAGSGGAIAIAPNGFLRVLDSTIAGNTATNSGGGIMMRDGGGLVIERSLISGNTTTHTGQYQGFVGGGAVFLAGWLPGAYPVSPDFTYRTVVLRNVTIAGNSTTGAGGGIMSNGLTGDLLLQNSTITGNTAVATGVRVVGFPEYYGGGGISGVGQNVTLIIRNSVVSGNSNPGGQPDIEHINNTIHLNSSAVGSPVGFTPSAESGNNLNFGLDLQLGPLQDNGGPTKTLAPLVVAGTPSPLTDAGSTVLASGIALDQRGLDRVFGASVDIGAVETQPPAVTINQAAAQADPTNGTSAVFDVTFAMPVAGFDASDVSLTGTAPGTLTPVVSQTSSTTYRVTVSGITGSGTVVASIPAGAGTDPNSQLASPASTSTDNVVSFDHVAPTVTVNQSATQADPTNDSPIAFDVVFSEPVVGFSAADVSFAGSTNGGILTPIVAQTGPASYSVAVFGAAGLVAVVVSIPAGSATDPAGNASSASTSTDNSVLFGETAPTVTINRAAGQPDPTNDSPIAFDVVFSEPVTGFEAADVSLAGSTAGGTLVAAVTPTGPMTYRVTVTGMTSRGTVVASIPAGVAIDSAGLPNAASTSVDNSVEFLKAGSVGVVAATGQTTTEGTTITFSVSRTGGSEGAVSINYATVAGTAHATTDFGPASGTFTWADGEAHDQSFTVTIAADGKNEGRELFAVELTGPTGGLAVGTASVGVAIAPSDGKAIRATDKVPAAVFPEASGPGDDLVTVKLTGKPAIGQPSPTATVYITDPDGDGFGPIEWIDLKDTLADKSVLTITVKRPRGGTGDGRTTLAELSGSGLKSFTATTTDLIGTGVHLNGYLGLAKVGNVSDGADFLVDGAPPATLRNPSVKLTVGVVGDGTDIRVTQAPLGSLTAIAIGDGTITAPTVGSITVKGRKATRLNPMPIPGDFKSDVTISGAGITDPVKQKALKSLKVAGAVVDSSLMIGGSVGLVSVGSFFNSRLFAGYEVIESVGTFTSAATVGPFVVKSKTNGFAGSSVIATNFKNVTLASALTANGGTAIGFVYRGTFAGLSLTTPTGVKRYDVKLGGTQAIDGDLEVKQVP